MTFTNEIEKPLDESQATVGVLFDLSKAFNWVDHSVLLTKLKDYGLGGMTVTH